jgi:hypothetical protein
VPTACAIAFGVLGIIGSFELVEPLTIAAREILRMLMGLSWKREE